MITTQIIIFFISILRVIIKVIIFRTQIIIFFYTNTLNYKRKNNIYNTHYYISACGWARTCPAQRGVPKCQVALGFAQRIGAAQASGAARVCPVQGSGSPNARCSCVGSVIDRCTLLMTCNHIKTCAGHFLPNHPFNTKCLNAPAAKRQPHPFPLHLQLFVSRAGLPLHCSN